MVYLTVLLVVSHQLKMERIVVFNQQPDQLPLQVEYEPQYSPYLIRPLSRWAVSLPIEPLLNESFLCRVIITSPQGNQ